MRRRSFLREAIVGGLTACATGCGTLLHKERINRPHSRDVDWKVVALNGLGLAFFFVPGVIAFVVDFHTGAIYLPPEYAAAHPGVAGTPPTQAGAATEAAAPRPASAPTIAHATPQSPPVPAGPGAEPEDATVVLRKVAVERQQLDQAHLERRVGDLVGRAIQLGAPTVRVSPMEQLSDFAAHRRQHDSDPSFGMSTRAFFRER